MATPTVIQFSDVCGKCGARRIDQQIGLEETPDAWAAALVAVFREARRVLRRDGTLWVECGDSYGAANNRNGGGRQTTPTDGSERDDSLQFNEGTYRKLAGYKPKDLIGSPWLLAFALRADGWWLRGCNIWAKPNAMPESAKDRCTTAHSYVFQLSKSARCFFDGDAISEPATEDGIARESRSRLTAYDVPGQTPQRRGPSNGAWITNGRHPRSVWTIPTQGYAEAHFATWPEALARRIILAGCPEQVCGECGKARVRIVERGELTARTDSDGDGYRLPKAAAAVGTQVKGRSEGWIPNHRRDSTTTDFTDCGHNAYEPGFVLDMFGGSGTTALVARKLGRHSILIELSEDYCALAAKRLSQQSLFADAQAVSPQTPSDAPGDDPHESGVQGSLVGHPVGHDSDGVGQSLSESDREPAPTQTEIAAPSPRGEKSVES